MRIRIVNPSPALAVLLVALYVLLIGWSAYAAACLLNHGGVWPFSYLGNG